MSKVSSSGEAVSPRLRFMPARREYQGYDSSFQLWVCFCGFFFPNVIQHSWMALLARRWSSPASEFAALQHLHMRGSPEVHCSKGSNFREELNSQQGNCCCAVRLPLCPSTCPLKQGGCCRSWAHILAVFTLYMEKLGRAPGSFPCH